VTCEESLAALCAGMDGEAGREELAEARRHIAGCASCRAEAGRLGKLDALLAAERRRRARWLAAAPVRAGVQFWLGPALAASAAALFAAGLCLERPWKTAPRLAVFAGEVTVNGRPARSDQRLPVGSKVTVGEVGSATLRYRDGTQLALSEKSELTYLGPGRGARSCRLAFGRVLAKVTENAGGLEISSDLGRARVLGTVFELCVSPILAGAAMDTPRTLRLAVARGRVELLLPGQPPARQVIPAGLAAKVIEGLPRVRGCEPLPAAEWQGLLGLDSAPDFADARLPAEKVPAGAWVPRWPGRHGPTPGSRTCARMAYSAELGGGVLLESFVGEARRRAAADGGTWLYDARADRWKQPTAAVGGRWSVTANQGECWDSRRGRFLCLRSDGPDGTVRISSRLPEDRGLQPIDLRSSGAPGARDYFAADYSPKADAVLLYGGAGGNSETWAYRCAADAWERLSPANNPPPRERHALYYDPSADLFVIYGGEGPGGVYDDVWVFRLPGAP